MSENNNIVEIHGCIVYARLFNILAVYTPDHKLVNWVVTSSGGHRVPSELHPLVVCDTHSVRDIEAAYEKWQRVNL